MTVCFIVVNGVETILAVYTQCHSNLIFERVNNDSYLHRSKTDTEIQRHALLFFLNQQIMQKLI